MIYAMVKKVVSPARSSVVNLVFLISSSCASCQYRGGVVCTLLRQTWSDPSRRKMRPNVDFATQTSSDSAQLRMASMATSDGCNNSALGKGQCQRHTSDGRAGEVGGLAAGSAGRHALAVL